MANRIFQKMSSWSQLFFLCLFTFGGLSLAIAISMIVYNISPTEFQSTDTLRVLQLMQAICLFLLPACLCAYLFNAKPLAYLKINRPIDLKFLLFSILLILAVQPFISFLGYYNNQIMLPASMSGIEFWMRDSEDKAGKLMEQLLTTNSPFIFAFNIFVIAIIAGITEEFFFRGSIQQIFKRICKNGHLAVWITAFIFSFIHFQFYGFFPRLILGAILGYLFLWSGNLWISVIVHAINNLMAILIFQFYHGTPQYEKLESFGTGNTLWITIVSVVISGSIMFLLSKQYVKNNAEELGLL